MALSDQLSDLSARVKQLEDHAAAAKTKTKSDLQQDVKNARASAQAQGEKLRVSAEAGKGRMSEWSESLQHAWSKHLKAVQKSFDDKKSAHDLKSAQKAADRADDDAAF